MGFEHNRKQNFSDAIIVKAQINTLLKIQIFWDFTPYRLVA
jgi:hypothetical protein